LVSEQIEIDSLKKLRSLSLGGAEMSEDGRYRYLLWRRWDRSLPVMVWVMLNPSTADADTDDATIRRCIGFAKRWGYGGIDVINLFAFRTTYPKELLESGDAVGRPRNIDVFYGAIDQKPPLIVAAWGNSLPPNHDLHTDAVRSVLRSNGAKCLGHTKSGEPRHPVRLAYDTELVPL
jgi:hypothetical protein